MLLCHKHQRFFILVIITALSLIATVNCQQQPLFSQNWHGGTINDQRVLQLIHSPFTINEPIVINEHGRLLIEPGTELRFAPRVGIVVRGSLIAKGLIGRKITLTKADGPAAHPQSISPTTFHSIRLVDGLVPNEGRLQLRYNFNTKSNPIDGNAGHDWSWYSVCTNSKNWTAIDIDVVCRQLGFDGGQWYSWFAKYNDSRQLMLEAPNCRGNERQLQECSQWDGKRIGSGICDYHMDIGIRCNPRLYAPQRPRYWAGIRFQNAEFRDTTTDSLGNKAKYPRSYSALEFVELTFAGENGHGEATPAIEVIGTPPEISHTTIRWSASTGVNITNPYGGFKIKSTRIVDNNGYGVFINSSRGQVHLENVQVSNNGADGVRYSSLEDLEVSRDLFCNAANLGDNQVYPVRLTHEQDRFAQSLLKCCQEYRISTSREAQLTAHFKNLISHDFEGEERDRHRAKDGFIEVYDGWTDKLVSKFTVRNETQPSSITSLQGRLYICYQPAILKRTVFTVVIVADIGRAYDLNITRSEISNNNGRGVWLEHQRTGTVLNHTVVSNNSYLAGVHAFDSGGDLIVNNSKIINNHCDGLNISLSDGIRHIDRSLIMDNLGRGIALFYNESRRSNEELVGFIPFQTEVSYSDISSNLKAGLFIGNVCRSDSFVNISMNSFRNNEGDAITFQSCWPKLKNEKRDIGITELLISNNIFQANRRLALLANPLINVRSRIEHNAFRQHKRGVIYINSKQLDENLFHYGTELAEDSIALVNITDNYFAENAGSFVVNVGLQENARHQRMIFWRNLLEKNLISEQFTNLNPRSKVAATLVISSSNVLAIRNNLINHGSKYEIGSHLEGHSKIINASYNFFGARYSKDGEKTKEIYARIFDRKNRYNLAQIEFLPYRTKRPDFNTQEFLSYDRDRDKYTPFRNGQQLGGEVRGEHILEPGIYQVTEDIFVRPGSKLVIAPNSVLNFDQSIGLMVQGKLESVGHNVQPITYTGSGLISSAVSANFVPSVIQPDPTPVTVVNSPPTIHIKPVGPPNNVGPDFFKFHNTRVMKAPSFNDVHHNLTIPEHPLIDVNATTENRHFDTPSVPGLIDEVKLPTNKSVPSIIITNAPELLRRRRNINTFDKIRLSNGIDGQLEVNVDGRWGAVCAYNFDINDAAIACQQMGLTLNRRDWLLESSQFVKSNSNVLPNANVRSSVPVVISNVKCSPSDHDLLGCELEREGIDFTSRSCEVPVGIKCYQPSWAGIRLGMTADESIIENVIIEKAGLLDYGLRQFKPALQIDFMRHRVKNVTIASNSDVGFGILWTDLFLEDEGLRTIWDCNINSNLYHGLEARSQGLRLKNSRINLNQGSAFNYEPMFSGLEQSQLVEWVNPYETESLINFPEEQDLFDSSPRTITLSHNRKSYYLKIKDNPPANFNRTFIVETTSGYSFGILVLNPAFGDATDNISISNLASGLTWNLRANLSSFPMLTYAYKLQFNYNSGKQPKGGLVLYLSVRRLPHDIYDLRKQTLTMKEERENKRIKTIWIENNSFVKNGRGLSASHYNRDLGEYGEYFHRHDNESLRLHSNLIEQSTKEAILVTAPFYDPEYASLAEINYTLVNNHFNENGRGIVHFSRDIRNSNNLFHWHIVGNLYENNHKTGIEIRLPYVWQYNENFTHSVVLRNNSIYRNHDFMFSVDGHFARMNVTNNLFKENQCQEGIMRVAGMEKELLIEENNFEGNFGHFVIEFSVQSHADQFGLVRAEFRRNSVMYNRDTTSKRTQDMYHPQSFALALRGVQFVNVTRNLFYNPNLQFELLAGVLTGSLNNRLNVEENWWGASSPDVIRSRIFDFDDWNSYAIADYSPYLGAPTLDAVTIPHESEDFILDLNQPIGGRIRRDLILKARPESYLVKSDLTVMPGSHLIIEPGVTMEFYPSVGLLVLGELTAGGYDGNPVIMRPVQLGDASIRFKRAVLDVDKTEKMQSAADLTAVRLCITETCQETIDMTTHRSRRDGFLEVYNRTTLQWNAVCDERFTERNAQVICRQLGFSTLNVQLRRGRRLDVGPTLISKVRYWPEPLECIGSERDLASCDVRLNGYGNHSHACTWDGETFVYINCGQEIPMDGSTESGNNYWGGIRFARPIFETDTHHYRTPTRTFSFQKAASRLQHIRIESAGILHGEKNAALQLIQRDINIEYINISNSAHHAIEVIAPTGHLVFHRLELKDNLGAGLNYLLLGGASTETNVLPYLPLVNSTLPYNVYGLVDICDTNKRLIVEERVLVYYKYDNRPVDCVKIFTAGHAAKRLGFRILQFNLFNSSNYAAVTDHIHLIDGDAFNQTSKLIGDLGVNEYHRLNRPERKFYSSKESKLSVKLHASGASEVYGFIAEVITLPVSYYVGRGYFHNITFSEMSRNVQGAIVYRSATETAPSVALDYNRFEYNCNPLYGNFTSCSAGLDFELQNSPQFFFRNNLVRGNQGGLHLKVNAQSAAAALNGIIGNNLFEANKNKEALRVQGPSSGSYQIVEVMNNYFTYNWAQYKTNIVLDKVVANFTSNVVVANTGQHQLSVLGFERVPISYQTIRHNWMYNNYALGSGYIGFNLNGDEKSTIFASTAGQRYLENYLVNPENDFELATMNRSTWFIEQAAIDHEKTREYWKSPINAQHNWWGFNETSAIASRILDQTDYTDLVRVNYTHFYGSNSSVLSGICSGGWQAIGQTCFLYVGARMTFDEAKRFCETQNSTMPVIRGNQREMSNFLYRQQDSYDHRYYRVWVQSFDYDFNECTVLRDNRIRRNEEGCFERLPFLCEKDPDIRVSIAFWYREPLGIAALIVSSITALLTLCCISCWLCKSKAKAKEKLQRRNSIRASIRSNRSYIASSGNSLNEIGYKRGLEKVYLGPMGQDTDHDGTPLHVISNPARVQESKFSVNSNNTFEKRRFDSSTTMTYDADSLRPLEDRFAQDPALENANVELMVRPTFDLTFQNEGFAGTPTPTASRASNVEYTEAREWPTPQVTHAKRPPLRTPSPSSVGEFSQRRSPASLNQFSQHSQFPQFNTYETTSNYETLSRVQGHTFSTFAARVPVLPPIVPRPPLRQAPPVPTLRPILDTDSIDERLTNNGKLEHSHSQNSLITNRTVGTVDSRRYLETSLDGESVQENNYDYCSGSDYRFRTEMRPELARSSPSMSILTASSRDTSRSKPMLETEM